MCVLNTQEWKPGRGKENGLTRDEGGSIRGNKRNFALTGHDTVNNSTASEIQENSKKFLEFFLYPGGEGRATFESTTLVLI